MGCCETIFHFDCFFFSCLVPLLLAILYPMTVRLPAPFPEEPIMRYHRYVRGRFNAFLRRTLHKDCCPFELKFGMDA